MNNTLDDVIGVGDIIVAGSYKYEPFIKINLEYQADWVLVKKQFGADITTFVVLKKIVFFKKPNKNSQPPRWSYVTDKGIVVAYDNITCHVLSH